MRKTQKLWSQRREGTSVFGVRLEAAVRVGVRRKAIRATAVSVGEGRTLLLWDQEGPTSGWSIGRMFRTGDWRASS